MSIQSYQDLWAWQKAMDLVTAIYGATRSWPREEAFCLTPQIRRAAISIPSNIAEGRGRRTTNEFRNHLGIAYGSLMELETQLLIARNLGYLTATQTDDLLLTTREVGRLMNALRRSLPDQRPTYPASELPNPDP